MTESINNKVHQAVSIITELLARRKLELGKLIMPYAARHIVISVLHPVEAIGFVWYLNKPADHNEERMLEWLSEINDGESK
jgi:hypothetical protein